MKLSRALSLLVCFLGTLAAYSGDAPDAEFKISAVAAFKNGLLTVTLPKTPAAKGTTIPIKAM